MGEILLVEDSPDIALIVKRSLEPENRVTICSTLGDANRQIGKRDFDLMILDVGLPDGDGFEFFAQMKQAGSAQIPTIFITGRAAVSDQVMGYSLGAEDYLIKPIQPVVLQAKIRARMKSIQSAERKHETVERGDIKIDILKQRVSVADRDVPLTTTEFKVLLHLMKNVDNVLSRDQMISAVWGMDTHVIDRTIDTHLSHLRKKLQSSKCSFESVHGVGYRFTVKG